jgi:hypothetical protein
VSVPWWEVCRQRLQGCAEAAKKERLAQRETKCKELCSEVVVLMLSGCPAGVSWEEASSLVPLQGGWSEPREDRERQRHCQEQPAPLPVLSRRSPAVWELHPVQDAPQSCCSIHAIEDGGTSDALSLSYHLWHSHSKLPAQLGQQPGTSSSPRNW